LIEGPIADSRVCGRDNSNQVLHAKGYVITEETARMSTCADAVGVRGNGSFDLAPSEEVGEIGEHFIAVFAVERES
jgi:hypothetical protein